MDVERVKEIVRGVRPIALPHFGKVEHTTRSTAYHDWLTALDIQVEEYLHAALRALEPAITFVGEETGGDRTAPRKWLCDPIDGTTHFVRGIEGCTTMLALIEDGEVTLGIIYDFVNDVLFHAERGKGAYRNEQPIHVSNRPPKESCMAWETQFAKEENVPMHLAVAARTGIFKTLTAGYEFTLVAMGKLDGRICYQPYGNDYDFAPGSLLVEEAGGVVANIGSRNYDYTNTDLLAVNPVIYKELTDGPDALFPIRK